MSGGLITEVGQWQIRELLLGPGTSYRIRRPGTTPHAFPDITSDDIPWDQAHGVHASADWAGGRRVPLKVGIMPGNRADALSALRDLQAAWAPSQQDIEIAWRDDLGTFRYVGRPRLADPNEDLVSAGIVEVDCRFLATNPFYESATESTASTGRTLPGTGFTPPFTPPFTLGASTAGTVRATNDGSVNAPWSGRLDGPLVNPVLTNLSTGDRLDFRANGGLSLAAGEYVDLASDGRSVLLAGTADRRLTLGLDSRWWDFSPGDTDIELTADSGAGTFTVRWRSAWI